MCSSFNKDNLNKKSHVGVLMLFLSVMQLVFLPEDKVSPFLLRLGSLRELFVFLNSSYFLKHR